MCIQNTINITELLRINYSAMLDTISLNFIEQLFIDEGLDRNSFSIFKIVYSDDIVCFHFHYPTDMTERQALEYAEKILN